MQMILNLHKIGKDPKTISKWIHTEWDTTYYTPTLIKRILESDDVKYSQIRVLREGMKLKTISPIIIKLGKRKEVSGKIKIVLALSCAHCFEGDDIRNGVPFEDRRIRPHLREEINRIKESYGNHFNIITKVAWLYFKFELTHKDVWEKYQIEIRNALDCVRLSIAYFPAIIIYQNPGDSEKKKIIPYQIRQGISSHHLYDVVEYIIKNKSYRSDPIPARFLTTQYKGNRADRYKVDQFTI